MNKNIIELLNRIAGFAGITVIIIGLSVLAGWMFEIENLKSVFPGLVTMKANTALSFVLAGIGLWILLTNRTEASKVSDFSRSSIIAKMCAVIVALVGLVTLSEYFFNLDLGIDQLFFNSNQKGEQNNG